MVTHADHYLLEWEGKHRQEAERWRTLARNGAFFPMLQTHPSRRSPYRAFTDIPSPILQSSLRRELFRSSPFLSSKSVSPADFSRFHSSETAMRAWKADYDAKLRSTLEAQSAATATPPEAGGEGERSAVLQELELAKHEKDGGVGVASQ